MLEQIIKNPQFAGNGQATNQAVDAKNPRKEPVHKNKIKNIEEKRQQAFMKCLYML